MPVILKLRSLVLSSWLCESLQFHSVTLFPSAIKNKNVDLYSNRLSLRNSYPSWHDSFEKPVVTQHYAVLAALRNLQFRSTTLLPSAIKNKIVDLYSSTLSFRYSYPSRHDSAAKM